MTKTQQPFSDSLKDGFYATYDAFLKKQRIATTVRVEQKKNTRVLQTLSNEDKAVANGSWGFVDGGTLFVRRDNYYVAMQRTFGSWSGLGVDAYEVYKMPSPLSPLGFAVDMVDIGANGPTRKYTPFKLYKLNDETGKLE